MDRRSCPSIDDESASAGVVVVVALFASFFSGLFLFFSRSYIGTKYQVEEFLNEVYLSLKELKKHIPNHREEVRRALHHLQKSWGTTALVFSGKKISNQGRGRKKEEKDREKMKRKKRVTVTEEEEEEDQ